MAIRMVRVRWLGSLILGVGVTFAVVGCGADESEVVSSVGGTASNTTQQPAPSTTTVPATQTVAPEPQVTQPEPPSVEGFVVTPPERFDASRRPQSATVQLDQEGVARLAIRLFVDRATGEQLTVAIHNTDPAEFDEFLKNYESYNGTIEEVPARDPYVRTLQLQPDDPDLPATHRELVGVLDDGSRVFVVGDLPWDELHRILDSAEGRPDSLQVQTFGDAVPAGIGVDSDEQLEEDEE